MIFLQRDYYWQLLYNLVLLSQVAKSHHMCIHDAPNCSPIEILFGTVHCTLHGVMELL